MTYQAPIDLWPPPRQVAVSRPPPTRARKLAAYAVAAMARGLFLFAMLTGFVVLPMSLLVLFGRILFG
jgi:hypothetical protein